MMVPIWLTAALAVSTLVLGYLQGVSLSQRKLNGYIKLAYVKGIEDLMTEIQAQTEAAKEAEDND